MKSLEETKAWLIAQRETINTIIAGLDSLAEMNPVTFGASACAKNCGGAQHVDNADQRPAHREKPLAPAPEPTPVKRRGCPPLTKTDSKSLLDALRDFARGHSQEKPFTKADAVKHTGAVPHLVTARIGLLVSRMEIERGGVGRATHYWPTKLLLNKTGTTAKEESYRELRAAMDIKPAPEF